MRAQKVQKTDRKTGLPNGFRWRFWRYNKATGKTETVPCAKVPEHIRNSADDEVVNEWCDSQSAIEQAMKYQAARRLDWAKENHNFVKLVELFAQYQKERAPNSWQNDIYYLEKYALHYFIWIGAVNNMSLWWTHFRQFKDWLAHVKPLTGSKPTLAKNTQNNIIKSLNRFLAVMALEGKCEEGKRCQFIPKHELYRKGAAAVIEPGEAEAIFGALSEIRPDSGELFQVLMKTGMRINESLGLCIPFIMSGKIDGKKADRMHEKLKPNGLSEYFGYICLESQPRNEGVAKIRSADGTIERRPLKSRKDMSARWYRYIPIWDREVWNILVKRWNKAVDEMNAKKWGKESRDYLLFEGFSASSFYQELVLACKNVGIKSHSPHDCRHTFCTWFYDVTDNNESLAEMVVGHRDKETRENYSHLVEQIGNEMKNREQRLTRLELV